MNNAPPNPIEVLIERLRAQLDAGLPAPAEDLLRRFLEPFSFLSRDDVADLTAALQAAEVEVARLTQRVEKLEQSAEQAAKKGKGKKKGKKGDGGKGSKK